MKNLIITDMCFDSLSEGGRRPVGGGGMFPTNCGFQRLDHDSWVESEVVGSIVFSHIQMMGKG